MPPISPQILYHFIAYFFRLGFGDASMSLIAVFPILLLSFLLGDEAIEIIPRFHGQEMQYKIERKSAMKSFIRLGISSRHLLSGRFKKERKRAVGRIKRSPLRIPRKGPSYKYLRKYCDKEFRTALSWIRRFYLILLEFFLSSPDPAWLFQQRPIGILVLYGDRMGRCN